MHSTQARQGLHPTMAAAITPLLTASMQMRRARYVSALMAHDLAMRNETCSRQEVREQRARLLLEAADVDPLKELWAKHCAYDTAGVPL